MIETSVVMISWSPTPERLKTLTRSFASLRAHTHAPHLLVVVDNGPADQTAWLSLQDIDIHLKQTVNIGIGAARNAGAAVTQTEYLAFVDSDLFFPPDWLEQALACLRKYPDRKLIACPSWSGPVRLGKHCIGKLGEYDLYNRASGQCLVMRRSVFAEIGPWSTSSVPGGDFCYGAREHGYRFIRHPAWRVKHLLKNASYDYRQQLIGGLWMPAATLSQESNP
jgi:GT2 family glycosyltransferase